MSGSDLHWYEFGHRAGRPDLVDIACNGDDIAEGVPKELADKLIAAHNAGIATREERIIELRQEIRIHVG